MKTTCPHCHVEIEIDPATHAALAKQSHFACPACEGVVPVPANVRPRLKISTALGTDATASAPPEQPSHRASAPTRTTNRKILILGATALLVLGGVAVYSVNSHHVTDSTHNEIINNSYFQDLIANRVTTAEDLNAIADIRPFGKNYIGVSQDSLPWEQALKLAERTGSQILPVADADSASRTELFTWVSDTFEGQLLPSPWVSKRGEAAILANSEVFPSNDKNRSAKVILYWQTDISIDEDEMRARRAYKNLGRSALDEKIVFGKGTNNILSPDNLAFDGISPKVQIIAEKRQFPVYESLWGQDDVFIIHPIGQNTPGTVDFSEITGKSRGELIIKVRDHPRGDCRIEVLKNNQSFETIKLNTDEWQTVLIPFEDDSVMLKIHATGWWFEFGFMTYEFSR